MRSPLSKISPATLERLFIFHAAITITIEAAILRDHVNSLILLSVAAVVVVFSFFPRSHKFVISLVGVGAALIAFVGLTATAMRGTTLLDHWLTTPNPNLGFPIGIYFIISGCCHVLWGFATFRTNKDLF